MKVKLPSWASIVLSIVAGILTTLNTTTFQPAEPWSTLITAGLGALVVLGISPLAHGALENVLHLPFPAALGLSSLLATSATAITTLSVNTTVKGVIIGAVTAVAGGLAGPDTPAPAGSFAKGGVVPHVHTQFPPGSFVRK